MAKLIETYGLVLSSPKDLASLLSVLAKQRVLSQLQGVGLQLPFPVSLAY